jgi:hypothetical protein
LGEGVKNYLIVTHHLLRQTFYIYTDYTYFDNLLETSSIPR